MINTRQGQSARFARIARIARFNEDGGPQSAFGCGVYISTYPIKTHDYDALILGSTLQSRVKKEEADSGSTQLAPLRAQESASLKEGQIQIRSRLNEAKSSAAQGSRFRVILIQEGLGNLSDCFFYTKDCLQGSVSLFEGVKCFADHPDAIQEQVRPERSTRDILGHFEGVKFEEQDGRGMLTADLCIVDDPAFDWARALLINSVQYAQKYSESEFVGLSINANGEATSVGLQDFIREQKFPPSVMEKIERAVSEGISEIRPVSSLKEATSCDLVTEAGAGGKILKMIEQERNPMSKKVRESKEDKKESDGMEMDKKGMEGGGGDDAGHSDADKDKDLIQKMIKQYLGDEHAGSEEAMNMAKEAHEAYKAECKDPKEAYEKAGMHLKMAAKIGDNMKQKKEDSDKTSQDQDSDKKDDDGKDAKESEEKKEEESHKESSVSLRTELLKAKAEITRLQEGLKKYELNEYLDKKLKESKRAVKITSKFREALGTPRSKQEIDQSFKIFMAGVDGNKTEEVGDDFSSFIMPEKTNNHFEESEDASTIGSFADCAE